MTTAYVAFGANVGDGRRTLATVAEELGRRYSTRVSPCFRSEPVGRVDQPWFVNACLELRGDGIRPRALLDELLALEARLGRDRAREGKNGPRTCDLDLLLLDDLVVDEPGLTVPHPRLHERAFVLLPLVELAGEALVVPGRGRVGALLDAVRRNGGPLVEKIV